MTSSASAAASALTCGSTSCQAASYSSGVSTGSRPCVAQPLVGEEVDVAAEHDVGAAAGHVGGDGDRAAPAGLGDDAGLLLVVLGVEHVVRDARASVNCRDRYSERSTLVVPISTGWPFS